MDIVKNRMGRHAIARSLAWNANMPIRIAIMTTHTRTLRDARLRPLRLKFYVFHFLVFLTRIAWA